MMIKINIHKTKILKFLLIEYKKELFLYDIMPDFLHMKLAVRQF